MTKHRWPAFASVLLILVSAVGASLPVKAAFAQSADKKPNIFQRIALFVRQTIAEMKKVTYPTKEDRWTYFLVVIVFVALMMLFTGVVDLGSSELSKLVFG